MTSTEPSSRNSSAGRVSSRAARLRTVPRTWTGTPDPWVTTEATNSRPRTSPSGTALPPNRSPVDWSARCTAWRTGLPGEGSGLPSGVRVPLVPALTGPRWLLCKLNPPGISLAASLLLPGQVQWLPAAEGWALRCRFPGILVLVTRRKPQQHQLCPWEEPSRPPRHGGRLPEPMQWSGVECVPITAVLFPSPGLSLSQRGLWFAVPDPAAASLNCFWNLASDPLRQLLLLWFLALGSSCFSNLDPQG